MSIKRTEMERLVLFRDKAEELKRRRLVAGDSIRHTFQVNTARPEEFTMTSDKDDFLAMLVTLRPFMSDREDVHLPAVHNILMRRLTDDGLRQHAIRNREEWRRLMSGWGFGRFGIVGQKTYGRRELFDLAMNSIIFHHDVEKQREYESLPPLYQAFAEAALYDMGISAAVLVFNEAEIVRVALDNSLLGGVE